MRVASNLLRMLAERGLQVGGGIAIVAMLARALGPSGFAHFQYAQSIVLIAGSFAFVCGAEVVVPRLVAAPGAATQHRLLAHAFLLRLAGGVAGYLLMCVYLGVTSPGTDVWHAALWLGIAILLRDPFGVVIAWMQAHTNNRPNTLFSLTALVVKAILVGSLFAAGIHEITGYVAAFALEAIVSAVLLTSYYFIRVPDRGFAWHPPQARELVPFLQWISAPMPPACRSWTTSQWLLPSWSRALRQATSTRAQPLPMRTQESAVLRLASAHSDWSAGWPLLHALPGSCTCSMAAHSAPQ